MIVVAFDFETHLIKPGLLAPKPVCLSWSRGHDLSTPDGFGADAQERLDIVEGKPGFWLAPTGLVETDIAARNILARLLRDPRVLLVGHNVAFDVVDSIAEWPELARLWMNAYDAGRVACTMVRQNLIDVAVGQAKFRPGNRRAGRDLAALVELYFNEQLPKEDTWRLRYGELDGTPISTWPADAVAYPIRDAKEARRLYFAQERFSEGGPTPLVPIEEHHRQARSALWLQLMASWGIRTDGERVDSFRKGLESKIAEALDALERRVDRAKVFEVYASYKLVPRQSTAPGFVRANGSRDMKAISAAVEQAYKLAGKPMPTTPGGAPATDADTLGSSGDPDLRLLGKVLSNMASLSKIEKSLDLGRDRPICARWNPLLESGRTSCSGPNLQNFDRKGGARETVTPRPGFVFASCDYDAIELRGLAQVCLHLVGHSELAEAFKRGQDPHLRLGARILGIPFSAAEALYTAGDASVIDARQMAKIPNFGFPGGLGAESFVAYAHAADEKYKTLVDVPMARKLREDWFTEWREMAAYFDHVSNKVGQGSGEIFQIYSGRRRGDVGFTQACNSYFQGLTADGAKAAGWAIMRECLLGDDTQGDLRGKKSPLWGSRMVLFIHDEFILEVPEARSSAAARRLSQVMQAEMQKWLPDVPVTCGGVLMRRWLKGAKAVEVDGLLVPSRPVKIGDKTTWEADLPC